MSLERAIEYIDIDEYVEATPKSLPLRKADSRRERPETRHRDSCLNQLINDDSSDLFGAACGMIGAIPFQQSILIFGRNSASLAFRSQLQRCNVENP
jgi:hypothetical protein